MFRTSKKFDCIVRTFARLYVTLSRRTHEIQQHINIDWGFIET